MAEIVEDKILAKDSSLSPVASKRNSRNLKQSGNPGADPDPDTKSLTALQQHVSFFDRNKDGIVYPWETFAGLRAIGFGIFPSTVLALLFNLGLSYASLPGWFPSLLFPIYVENIHRDKHGSDTDIYDKGGRFVPENFENLFSTYALTLPNKLTAAELRKMTEDNREIYDFIGWTIAKGEWSLLYFLAKDEDGFLSKEAVRGCYDGTLFEQMAMKHTEKRGKTN